MRDLESFIAEIESLAASEQNFAAQFGEAYQLVRPHEAGFFFDVMPQKKTVPIYARNRLVQRHRGKRHAQHRDRRFRSARR